MKDIIELIRQRLNGAKLDDCISPLAHKEVMELVDKLAQLQQPVIVRGGASETKNVHRHKNDLKWDDFLDTPNTPTEPLPAEGQEKSVCAEGDHDIMAGPHFDYCSKCYKKL